MKIREDHYEHMKASILELKPDLDVMRQEIVAEGRAKDVEKRLRWDLNREAGLTGWLCDTLYEYLDDSHIDTALRNVMKEVEEEYRNGYQSAGPAI